ncbi:Cytochrome c oxidase assembly protein COX15 [Spathaspora sp. JA1]|nr:Cytochrome c oxidase assembly protein COX15 [Spathaspora sp. JA1]
MLSRSRFFFTKNSHVLNTLAQSKGCRLTLSQTHIQSKPSKLISSIRLSRLIPGLTKRSFRSYSTTTATPVDSNVSDIPKINITIPKSTTNNSRPTSPKVVGWWLIGTSGLVFSIVVIGGLTRLTESGLSITEWKPVTGALPPMNQAEWLEEFAKYKESPEFKQLNSHISLEQFKFIYSMEWGHRQLGRFIGLFFIFPAMYFWKSGRFTRHITRRVVLLTGLLGLQGAIGWWMVKSGLDEENLAERNSKPTVSQYRLTTHLGAAFIMYLGVLWTAFEILNENKYIKQAKSTPEALKTILEQLNNPVVKKTKIIGASLLALTFITAMSGGMVAGLDAGLIYNTFPHMGDDWIPNTNELMSPIYSRKPDQSDLWWRNLLENPTTVQLVHRIFATTTFFAILAGHMYVNKNKASIPKQAKKVMHTTMGFAMLQVALGITTLIYLVPIPLAAAHQAGALALLTASLAFSARLKKPRPELIKYVNDYMKLQLKPRV